MRYVQIPAPITCVDPVTKKAAPGAQTMTFHEFMVRFVLSEITGSRKAWNQANRIEQLILGAADSVLALDDADWLALQRACEAPKLEGNSTRQLVPFLNAVCDATTSDPREAAPVSRLGSVPPDADPSTVTPAS